MLVKNISGFDVSFMFQSPKSTEAMPVFDTVNIVTGWTVDIPEDIWAILSSQTISISTFVEETLPIEDGKPTIKGFGGESVTPTRKVRQWKDSKNVNMIQHMLKTRQIEIVQGEEVPMPSRPVMESFLKRYGEKVTAAMTDEELVQKVRIIKAEIEALASL